jgi:hypothetical protein
MSVDAGSGKPFFVNGFDINTIDKFEVDRVEVGDPPTVNLATQSSVRGDGSKTTYGNFGIRPIVVSGHIIADDWYDYLAVRAQLLKALFVGPTGRALNAELKHYVDSAQTIFRVYHGNVTSNSLTSSSTASQYMVTAIESGKAMIALWIQCEDPFGYDVAATSFNAPASNKTRTQIGASLKYTVKSTKTSLTKALTYGVT